jgi:uncharacterized protein YkwD
MNYNYFDISVENISKSHRFRDPLNGDLSAIIPMKLMDNVKRPSNAVPIPDPINSASTWARPHIESALIKGFIPEDIQSSYQKTITRREFCRMAVKWVEYVLDKPISAVLPEYGIPERANHTFSDTSDASILAAYRLGITSGTTAPTASKPGLFTPNSEFTRQEAATMIMNTCRAIGADVRNAPISDFADMKLADTWAHLGINFVRANGIMSGVTSTPPYMFDPMRNYTREESITTFNNINAELLPGFALPTAGTPRTISTNPDGWSMTNMNPQASYPISDSAGFGFPGGYLGDGQLWGFVGTDGYESAVDGNINTRFTGGYVGLRSLVNDDPQILLEVRILHSQASGYSFSSIQGSNDGITWVDMWVGKVPTDEFNFRAVFKPDFKNNTGWTYFRYVTDAPIAEIEFYGSDIIDTNYPPPIAPPSTVHEYEREVWRLVNEERAKFDLRPLDWHDALADVARAHCVDMAQRNFYGHVNPDGLGPLGRAAKMGLFFVGENIGGRQTPQEAVNGWMNSTGHRSNILLPSYNYIGVGYHSTGSANYWTQNFM